MKLSFVIPAYNEERFIGDCLESIIKQKDSAACQVEIIVVDNASKDHTADVVRKYPGVILVRESRKGLLFARQAGFLRTTGDLIAQVDADSRLTPGWISKVAGYFAADGRLVALSGPYIYYDLSAAQRFWARIFYYVGYLSYLVDHFILKKGAMLQGGNTILRRSALEKIGGYDTKISFYGEDTDLARRISQVGKVIFTFNLPIMSSGRRLAKEGTIRTGARYAVNYFWILLFRKPYNKDYTDVRT